MARQKQEPNNDIPLPVEDITEISGYTELNFILFVIVFVISIYRMYFMHFNY